jgi:integrase
MATDVKKSSNRGKGEGAVYYEEARDRWVGLLDLGGEPRRRRKVTGRSRSEVTKRLAALRVELGMGVDVSKRPPTIAELVDQWCDAGYAGITGRKSVSTRATLDRRLRGHLVLHLGRLRVSEVKPSDFERWWRKEAARGLALRTIRDYRSDAIQLMNYAMKHRLVTWNCAQVASLPEAGASSEKVILTRDERERLYEALTAEYVDSNGQRHRERLEAFFILLAYEGLRPGEAQALRWSDVDLEAGVVHVRRAVKRGDGGRAIEIGAPKTSGSVRSLRVSSRVLDALKRHRAAHVTERLAAGSLWSGDDRWADLVFTSELGTPLHPSNVRRALTRTCERAGIPIVTPYGLRHTVATILSDDVDLIRVADQLGHTDTRMVERVYRHGPAVVSTAAEVEQRYEGRESRLPNGTPVVSIAPENVERTEADAV